MTMEGDEMTMEAPLPGIGCIVARKALRAALVRTLHAVAKDDEAPPGLACWWIALASESTLTVTASDNYRIARAEVEVTALTGEGIAPAGPFAIHHSHSKAMLAFLVAGPDEALLRVGPDGWSLSCRGDLSGAVTSPKRPDFEAFAAAWPGGSRKLALNAGCLADAGKAADGGGTPLVSVLISEDPRYPVVLTSEGLTEWVMPVQTP